MKKTLVLVFALVLGLVFSAYAQEQKVTETKKVTGDKTVETVKAEGPRGTAEQKVTTTPTAVKVDSKVKGENVKIDKSVTETSAGVEKGMAKVDVKKGAIEDLKIEWTYEQVGKNYVLTYNVKEHNNPKLVNELGLTPDQAKAMKPGEHKIVSTSPYTVDDVKQNFRKFILQDIKTALKVPVAPAATVPAATTAPVKK